MIVAMGTISADGTLLQEYNVDSVVWDDYWKRWEVELTGINYSGGDYVTLVAAYATDSSCSHGSVSGLLTINVHHSTGSGVKRGASFVVLKVPVATR